MTAGISAKLHVDSDIEKEITKKEKKEKGKKVRLKLFYTLVTCIKVSMLVRKGRKGKSFSLVSRILCDMAGHSELDSNFIT